MLINRALSCWTMKNSPALSRLHRGTHRMTDCTFLPPSGRKILHQIVCFARDTRSVSCWCCRLVCLNWAALIWKFLAWSQSEWSLLSWHSAAAKYAAGLMSHRRRVLRISVGQCSGTPGSWDDSLLERETPAFILPDLWPANSPDLNPTDYEV